MRLRAGALALLALALLAGCASAPPVKPSKMWVKPVAGPAIVRMARTQMGKPYASGGHDPATGFDCSGLVWWCYQQFDSQMPRRASEQYKVGDAVERRDMKPGDLVFFDTGVKPKPGHIGIYVGNGRFLHAPATGEQVREDELQNNYWRRSFVGARRIE